MKLLRQAKVIPPDANELLAVMRQFNRACNWLSVYAYRNHVWHWHRLQVETYRELRDLFGLTSSAAYMVIRKVATAYSGKNQRDKIARFRPLGSMPLYQHYYKRDRTVGICGHRYSFESRWDLSAKYQGILCYQNDKFILYQIMEVAEDVVYKPDSYIGCDLGLANILVDSDRDVHSSGHLLGLRRRYAKIRSRLDGKHTRSAHRLLRKRRRKEGLLGRDVNHCISKKLVMKAKDTHRGIALEALKEMRITAIEPDKRRRQHSWSFWQLRHFIEYKARLNGVPVIFVEPYNTSRTCPECGYTDKDNRKSQSEFVCNSCGYADLADYVAARNIASRADGNQPNVASTETVTSSVIGAVARSTKPIEIARAMETIAY